MAGRRMICGLTREDAARDNMRDYGFQESVITQAITELRDLYGENGWRLIEDGSYCVLLERCLEKQREQANQVAGAQNQPVAGAQNQPVAGAENEEEMVEAQNQEEMIGGLSGEDGGRDKMRDYGFQECVINRAIKELKEVYGEDGWKLIEDGGYSMLLNKCLEMHHAESIGSNSSSLNSTPAALQSGVGSSNRAAAKKSKDEDSEGDDDEMIQLVPEPLCPELQEMLNKLREENKKKRL